MTRPVNLIDAAKYYKGLAHQNSAWIALDNALTPAQRDLFTQLYRRHQKPYKQHSDGFPLDVEYFYQRDSKTGHGERSCQSSALAMAIEYIDPNVIFDDDEYLRVVLKYGDTVSQMAQKAALDSLGVKNQFRMNGKEEDLLDLLNRGYPVPIGVLHKGGWDAPSGGGHWITLIGYDEEYFEAHDPFGCMDILNGGYPKAGSTDGKNVRYTREPLMDRWLITSDSDGWFWDLSMNPLK